MNAANKPSECGNGTFSTGVRAEPSPRNTAQEVPSPAWSAVITRAESNPEIRYADAAWAR